MSAAVQRRPLVLCVLDGFGLAEPGPHNAITLARTPHWDRLRETCGVARLSASGEDVGLPAGQFGNSEVGHLNLGAGRIVYQEILRISRSIRDGSIYQNAALAAAAAHLKRTGGALHLLGLVSDGGVHSHLDHLAGLLQWARAAGVARLYLHAFLDGRDTPPRSALAYAERAERLMRETGVGVTATVTGRYYAMDRDQRWERTAAAYEALVHGQGLRAASFREAIEAAYARGEGDEFVRPTVLPGSGEPHGLARDGDAFVCFNFRPDRVRQITRAIALDDCPFDRGRRLEDVSYVCFTQYDARFGLPIAFPPQRLSRTMGDVYADAGLRQLRLAETEKYAHVTYFFSGGVEAPVPNEERVLVPSPKVATYDLAPEMSAAGVTEALEQALRGGRFDLIVMNYANADMVGHTGVQDAAVRAIEFLDGCIGRVADATRAAGGVFALTADHGNAEVMWDEVHQCPHTAHTANRVPFVVQGATGEKWALDDGILADVAPTLLRIVGLPVPEEMSGRDLRRAATPASG